MKLKNLASIFKTNKVIYLYDKPNKSEDGITQWVSNGSCLYPINGLPYLTTENVLTIFDIPEDKHSDWRCEVHQGMPEGISFEDTDEFEEEATRQGRISLMNGGNTLRPLSVGDDIIFIDTDYLKPLADVREEIRLYRRKWTDGLSYIVVKVGFFLQAVLLPYRLKKEDIEGLGEIVAACRGELKREHDAQYEGYFDEIEQMLFKVDPDTGEVLEPEDEDGNGA